MRARPSLCSARVLLIAVLALVAGAGAGTAQGPSTATSATR